MTKLSCGMVDGKKFCCKSGHKFYSTSGYNGTQSICYPPGYRFHIAKTLTDKGFGKSVAVNGVYCCPPNTTFYQNKYVFAVNCCSDGDTYDEKTNKCIPPKKGPAKS